MKDPGRAATEVPIEVRLDQLSAEAIAGVIESFILREGTDYGLAEVSFEKKAEQLRLQIKKGEIRIVFDRISETVSLIADRDFRRLTGAKP
ncbi:MAG: YheU family protein [Bdellovibrionales bacterium]|nr:YheU family protein [Bdellovibrionales bacterium]